MGTSEPGPLITHKPHVRHHAISKGTAMKFTTQQFAILGLMLTSACSPEIGSERWCTKMDETPKGEWSLNDAKAYAKHCMFADEEAE